MIKFVAVLFPPLCMFCSCNYVAQSSFFTTFGGSSNDFVYSVQQTNDSGFIAAGFTESFGVGGSDVLLAKYFFNGTLEWANAIGGSGYDAARSVRQTNDGGYVTAGDTTSFHAMSYDVMLTKYFSNGKVEWAKILGGAGKDKGRAMATTSDGGFIVTGYTKSFTATYSVLLARYASNGDLIWAKNIGGVGGKNDLGHGVQQTKDGGFIVTGEGTSHGSGVIDCLLLKFYPNGTLEWGKVLGGGSGQDWGIQVQQTFDGGYVFVGSKYSTPTVGHGDVLLARFSPNGTLLWATGLGTVHRENGRSVQQTSDGGFIVTGRANDALGPSDDVFLAKFSKDGVYEWGKILGDGSYEYGWAQSLDITSDGGYIIAGQDSSSDNAGSNDAFLSYVRGENEDAFTCWNSTSMFVSSDITSVLTLHEWNFQSVDQTDSYNFSTMVPYESMIGVGNSTVKCKIFNKCFGFLSDDVGSVCNGHGHCTHNDHCACFDNYYTDFCNITTCYDLFSNDSSSCGGVYGTCVGYNDCECVPSAPSSVGDCTLVITDPGNPGNPGETGADGKNDQSGLNGLAIVGITLGGLLSFIGLIVALCILANLMSAFVYFCLFMLIGACLTGFYSVCYNVDGSKEIGGGGEDVTDIKVGSESSARSEDSSEFESEEGEGSEGSRNLSTSEMEGSESRSESEAESDVQSDGV